jgi:PucR family transcriptional regulator, purine catabolism regulatory protein
VLSAWDHARHCLPGAVECRAVPVATGRERAGGHLVAMAVDGEFSTLTSAALERASGLIALATQLSRHEEILAARARGNLLVSLLEGDLSETEIARQVEAVGFPPGVPHLLPCVLSPLDAHQSAHGCDDTIWTLVWRDVRRELVGQKVPVIGGLVPGTRQIALVVGLAGADQRQPRADSLARLFHAALQRQFGVTGAAALYVGASSRSWTGITSSLAEVLDAAEFPRGGSRWHDATAPDLDRLLWRLRDSGDLQTFVRRRLGPLIEHDRRRTMKLLPTLEAYLTLRGHKAETARALHIERQSVYYRIAQIETLLGASLDDEEVRLGVHLALRASRVAGATATATDHEGPIETRSHLKIGRSRVAALPPAWTAANHQTARRQASETSHL